MPTEYKVRPVKRFIVTRFESDGKSASSTQIGEYQNGNDADLVADAMVALDKSKGIDSIRVREGMSLGEVISGKRISEESSRYLLIKKIFHISPEGELSGGEATVVFTLKGQTVFSETIRGKSSSPFKHRIGCAEGRFPDFDGHHCVVADGTQFGYEVMP